MHFLHAGTEDVKDILFALRECAVEHSGATDTMKHQVWVFDRNLSFCIRVAYHLS